MLKQLLMRGTVIVSLFLIGALIAGGWPQRTQAQDTLQERVEALESLVEELSQRVEALEGIQRAGDETAVDETAEDAIVEDDEDEQTSLPTEDAVATRNANLRTGPGTEYDVAGTVAKDAVLEVVGCNSEACTWYALEDGTWIAAFLVSGAAADLEIADAPAAPPEENTIEADATESDATGTDATGGNVTAAPSQAAAPPTRGCPNGGCTSYPVWCDPAIKGNISYNSDEKIYFVVGQEYYEQTKINPDFDERWFCTEEEAEAAGWRRAYD